ncbi:MAG: putative rane-bound dehydrogenase, partial [Verrucomicrobiaceae bacterium]|nr:putative rane-bound dehydrogenase [Verrucomicrobiaceae bacterium]
ACAAPDIWNLQDTDGDGVCDKRDKLYTGLGTGDTHAVINNLRWGLDGWVYATHGYSSGHVTSPDGSKDFGVDGSGVVRFKPDGSAFEMYSSKGGNCWGLDMTWDGQCFWTQPTSGTVFFNVVLPEYVLAKGKIPGTTSSKGMIEHQKTFPLMSWKEQAYVQIDQVGQYTAAAGCAIYEGGAWPEKWNHSYFTGEPTLNIVSQYFVKKDGVSYSVEKEKGREETEFIRSKDMWFRPIEERVGPDGALYIVDFYNQAVIHNDTRGPLHGPANAAVRPDRDHYFGRIWKVQHKQAKKLEVPVLDKANVNQLLQAVSNPSAHVRMTASRLLIDLPNPLPPRDHLWLEGEQQKYAEIMEKNFGYKSLLSLALDSTKSEGSRAAALQVIGVRDSAVMLGWTSLLQDDNPVIRRLASLLAERFTYGQGDGVTLNFVTNSDLNDNDAQVRIAALRALASCNVPAYTTHEMARQVSADNANAIVKAWPKFSDDFEKSAAIAALSRYLGDALPAILDSGDASLAQVASILAQSISEKNDSDATAKLVSLLADKSAKADALKIVILQGIARQGTGGPALTPSLTEALKKLLNNPATAGAALPLVSKWDKAGVLANEVKFQISGLSVILDKKDARLPDRISAAKSLISIGGAAAEVGVQALAAQDSPPELAKAIITALDESGNVGPLVAQLAQLKSANQQAAFDAVLKHPEATLALLDIIKNGKLDPKTLGPANLARLRTHPNKQVARKANELLKSADAEKNKLLATLVPEVEKPGDAAKGHMIFTAACSICHQIGTEGKLVGPQLTGMGAHGPGELIVSVIDPNREVDPSFWAWNVIKKNGEALAGVIVSENQASLTLRNQVGEFEIKKDDIKTRENTRRSLMPEGFEALGAENLRDLLAFICGGADNKFRVLDLRGVYDADSRAGIFAHEDAKDETVTLHKFGNVTVEGVPFFIMDPEKSPTGANLIALKGGHKGAVAESFPATVEIATNVTAASLHFLGGVAGWGWPFGGDKAIGQPAMTVRVEYADGDAESIVLNNGEYFVDYIGKAEVPLSDNAGDFTRRGQLRYFAINLKKKAQLKKVVLETSGSIITPCTVAITAGNEPAKLADSSERKANKPQDKKMEPGKSADAALENPKEGGKGDGPLAPPTPIQWEPGKFKVLVIGGGSSHNFAKFFGGTDVDTLKADGFSVNYTEDRDQAAVELANADVAVISVNRQFFDTPAYRKALFGRIAAGKGVIMLHPGTWYGYGKWPELNAQIIGGGARGHDKLGPFSVHVLAKDHPIMKDVPPAFDVIDELYHV